MEVAIPLTVIKTHPTNISQIGTDDFLYPPKAPMVSAFYDESIKGIHFRISFFSSGGQEEPIIAVAENNTDFYILYQEGTVLPAACVWYFEFVYPCEYIDRVTVYNHYIDPKTSRGTITIVQSAEPPRKPLDL